MSINESILKLFDYYCGSDTLESIVDSYQNATEAEIEADRVILKNYGGNIQFEQLEELLTTIRVESGKRHYVAGFKRGIKFAIDLLHGGEQS